MQFFGKNSKRFLYVAVIPHVLNNDVEIYIIYDEHTGYMELMQLILKLQLVKENIAAMHIVHYNATFGVL